MSHAMSANRLAVCSVSAACCHLHKELRERGREIEQKQVSEQTNRPNWPQPCTDSPPGVSAVYPNHSIARVYITHGAVGLKFPFVSASEKETESERDGERVLSVAWTGKRQ